MRAKALLVGAVSPFIGPWVHLEEGEWIVEALPSFGDLVKLIICAEDFEWEHTLSVQATIVGPVKVRVVIETEIEDPIYLSTQMLHASVGVG